MREALREPADLEARERLVADRLRVFAHSFFAVLDGASADSAAERVLVTDIDGRELRPGLHEWWVDYLFETGRET